MRNDDRLADLYYRRIYSPEAQDACRDRIHWLCERAEGQRVLDLGCSQGIGSILLAREGYVVYGIDIERDAIKAAREELAKETQEVRERVTLRVADAFTVDLKPASFDTVIAGELLEHLANPARLLERITRWLRPGGRFALSVPHGYAPFYDHKHTYYVLRLVELLSPHFEIETIEPVHAQYLCAVTRRPKEGRPAPPPANRVFEWITRGEDALTTLQRDSYRERTSLREECHKLTQRAAEYRWHIDALKTQQDTLREEIAALKDQKEVLKKNLQQVSADLERWRAQAADSERREKELAREKTALTRELEVARRELRTQTEKLAASEALGESHREAQARLKELEREAARIRQELMTAKKQLAAEREKNRVVSARANRLSERLETVRAELALREQEVRYRLGDAFVRAARPSVDTLLLPGRIARLFFEGVRRARARRKEAALRKEQSSPRPPAPSDPPDQATAPRAQPADAAPPPSASADSPTRIDGIPTLIPPFASAPPEQIVRKDLRIAGVMDEFSWRAWQFEADLFTFTPKNWREVLEARQPHVVLIESTWSGIDDSWYFQVRDLCKRPDAIRYYAIPDIIAWCRKHDVPTVFYNKEDPPNFDVFIDAAKRFDYVFTSDANCIEDYRKYVGHDRVYALPFAAQPRIHNPVLTGQRTGTVCFAGTWYAHRHFQRQEDSHKILRPALDFDLHIFDRMAHSDNPNYRWPDEYLSAVRGALPYAQMLTAYKRYKVFMNINSVTDSPTMFSRRVFELLASGTPVVSSYSLGIERLLGADLVGMSQDEATTRALLERLLGDDQYRERLALRGQRKVFCEHTYTHRLTTILDAIGLDVAPLAPPRMAFVAAVEHPTHVQRALDHFAGQRYPQKALVLCATDAKTAEAARQAAQRQTGVSVIHEKEALWGKLLRRAVEGTEADFFVALNPADHYGPHYLTDYANATRYVTEPAIGKSRYYGLSGADLRIEGKGSEYRYVSQAYPWTLCLRRDKALSVARRLQSARSTWEWWNRAARDLGRLYSPDRFNYVRCAPQPGSASPGDNGKPAGDAAAPATLEQLEPASV